MGPDASLTASPAVDRYPAWSPTPVRVIAFVSDRSGNDDVYLMEVDGSG